VVAKGDLGRGLTGHVGDPGFRRQLQPPDRVHEPAVRAGGSPRAMDPVQIVVAAVERGQLVLRVSASSRPKTRAEDGNARIMAWIATVAVSSPAKTWYGAAPSPKRAPGVPVPHCRSD